MNRISNEWSNGICVAYKHTSYVDKGTYAMHACIEKDRMRNNNGYKATNASHKHNLTHAHRHYNHSAQIHTINFHSVFYVYRKSDAHFVFHFSYIKLLH